MSVTIRYEQNEKSKHTARLKKLNDGPNGDMLEGGIWTGEETVQVLVHSTFRFIPNFVESGVVVACGSSIYPVGVIKH